MQRLGKRERRLRSRVYQVRREIIAENLDTPKPIAYKYATSRVHDGHKSPRFRDPKGNLFKR